MPTDSWKEGLEFDPEIVAQWLIKTRPLAKIVPSDEGNEDALLYNLVHLFLDGPGFAEYDYQPQQDIEIEAWRQQRDNDAL